MMVTELSEYGDNLTASMPRYERKEANFWKSSIGFSPEQDFGMKLKVLMCEDGRTLQRLTFIKIIAFLTANKHIFTVMLKKFVSIVMLYSALAIMLGHNFIEHHHHNFDHNGLAHHHCNGHHHHNDDEHEDDSNDWSDLFAGIHHGAEGLSFLVSRDSADSFSKLGHLDTALHALDFVFNQVVIELRQKAPPYIPDDYNSLDFLPSGLRAPPVSIV